MNFKFLNIGLVILLLCISFISINTNHCKAESSEIYVKESYFGSSDGTAEKPYKTIQSAISAASDGDIIYIFGGLYREKIIIDKQLKIVGGVDEVETIIDSRFDDRYVVEITADEVTLEYVTVSDDDGKTTSPIGALIALKSDNNRIVNNNLSNTGSYGIYVHSNSGDNLISSNNINGTKSGIYLTSSSTNDIVNNKISNCSSHGIYIENSPVNNRIYGNNISSSNSGIYIKNSASINISNNVISKCNQYSIYLSNCANSLIYSNALENSTSTGVYLQSSDCNVNDNTFYNNIRGVYISGNSNILTINIFKENTASGIYVQTGANQNKIYENKFIDNGKSAQDYGNNQWHYQYKGNYWSDYDNVDKDLDGIGDVAYSKNDVLDLYPLGYFLKPPKKPSEPDPEDFETGVGLSITLKVYIEDPDSNQLTVYFYKGDDDTLIESSSQNPVRHVQNDSIAECSFTLGFDTVFTWYAIVDDGLLQNTSDPFIFSTRKTPPDNEPPIADAGGPYLVEVGELVQFDSSGCYDPDGTIAFYRWNFGDGSSEILEETPTHTYRSPMEYQVTLTIIDNNGSSASSNTYVSVGTEENDPPVAKITLVETAETGEQILFDGSETYDPDGDSLTYLWYFGNDDSSTSESPSYSYSSSGTYLVTLTVSDGQYSNSENAIITITKKETPGFELIFIVIAIAIAFIIKKKR